MPSGPPKLKKNLTPKIAMAILPKNLGKGTIKPSV
jgi:hypothetical protein